MAFMDCAILDIRSCGGETAQMEVEMSERRFVILLADTEQTWGLPCITESELIRRLNLIDHRRFTNLTEAWDWDKGISILLQGKEVRDE